MFFKKKVKVGDKVIWNPVYKELVGEYLVVKNSTNSFIVYSEEGDFYKYASADELSLVKKRG